MDKQDFIVLNVAQQLPHIKSDLKNHEVKTLSWFVEKFTPAPEVSAEVKAEIMETLEEGIDDKALLGDILVHCVMETPTSMPELFISTMWMFSRLGGVELSISEAGGLAHLVSVLTTIDNNEQLTKGLKTLACLACDKGVRDMMAHEGVITLLLSILNKCKTSSELTLPCLAALNNIFFQCLQNKQTFTREGGFSVFKSVIEAHINDLVIIQAAIVVLRNICGGGDPFSPLSDDHRISLCNDGIIPLIHNISTCHPSHVLVQDHVLWCLLNISLNSREIKGVIKQANVIPMIYQILSTHKTNKDLVLNSVTLLNQISTRTTTRVAVAKEEGIQVALEMLYSHEHDLEIQLMCLKLIDILCTLSLCRKRLAQEGRLKGLLGWLMTEECMAEQSYINIGLNICQKLAMSAAESKQALQECSGYTFFVSVNSHYSDDQDIQFLTVTGMSSLAEQAEYDNESSEEEVLSSDASGSSSEDYDY